MLVFLDIVLTIFHTGLVLFNLIGWIWRKTRRIHLVFILTTLVSWVLIGWWVGNIGYCFLTDWHWDIKRKLGERVGGSFNKYMLDKIFSYDFAPDLIDWVTGVGLVLVIVLSVCLNWRDVRRMKPDNN